jgi:hypothetical protein
MSHQPKVVPERFLAVDQASIAIPETIDGIREPTATIRRAKQSFEKSTAAHRIVFLTQVLGQR